MKKKPLKNNRKLSLSKSTIAKLNESEMKMLNGGMGSEVLRCTSTEPRRCPTTKTYEVANERTN